MEKVDHEKSARTFLELASEQRLGILENLREKEFKLSALAKLLGATPHHMLECPDEGNCYTKYC